MAEETFEFETNEGKVHSFATEKERDDFGIDYTIMNLVAEGYGEITEVDGEKAFKINERGVQHFKNITGVTTQ